MGVTARQRSQAVAWRWPPLPAQRGGGPAVFSAGTPHPAEQVRADEPTTAVERGAADVFFDKQRQAPTTNYFLKRVAM